MALEKYHFHLEKRPRTQHRNADGLSKRTNDYCWREQQLEKLPPVAERWNFLSQDEHKRFPSAPWFGAQGRVIPNHPDLLSHWRHGQPTPPNLVQLVILHTQRTKLREKQKEALQAPLQLPPLPVLHSHEDFYSDYPDDWIDVTEEASHDYLLGKLPAIRSLTTDLHEPAHTVHGIKDLVLAQNRAVHVLALKKLVNNENIDQDIFPEDVRASACNYFKQKKRILKSNGVQCCCMNGPA